MRKITKESVCTYLLRSTKAIKYRKPCYQQPVLKLCMCCVMSQLRRKLTLHETKTDLELYLLFLHRKQKIFVLMMLGLN